MKAPLLYYHENHIFREHLYSDINSQHHKMIFYGIFNRCLPIHMRYLLILLRLFSIVAY